MKKIIIIIIILVILGLVFVIFPGRKGKAPEEGGEEVVTNQEPGGEPTQPPERPLQVSPEEQLKRTLNSRARSFAARYGSFSSDSNFQNLYELKNQMTPSFWQEKEAHIKEAKPVATFYGISTKALSIKLIEFDPETRAEFLVSCQRQETRDSEQKVIYQDINIVFVKVNNNWLVDNAQWQ
jgi:hypothetical protein